MLADTLTGELKPFWLFELTGALPPSTAWNGTSDPEH